MKLSEKGSFAPPPHLEPVAQLVAETVAAWEAVQARAHWRLGDEKVVDGADFYLGESEVGHIHLYSEAHVFHSPGVAQALIKGGLSERFPWSRNVAAFAIKRATDVDHAIWLFQLSYQRCQGATDADLFKQVGARVTLAQSRGSLVA